MAPAFYLQTQGPFMGYLICELCERLCFWLFPRVVKVGLHDLAVVQWIIPANLKLKVRLRNL